MKLKYFPSVSAEEKPCFDISEDLGDGNFGFIGEVYEEEKAVFIVKACNNHYKQKEKSDKLLDALNRISIIASCGEGDHMAASGCCCDIQEIYYEAIKQVENDNE